MKSGHGAVPVTMPSMSMPGRAVVRRYEIPIAITSQPTGFRGLRSIRNAPTAHETATVEKVKKSMAARAVATTTSVPSAIRATSRLPRVIGSRPSPPARVTRWSAGPPYWPFPPALPRGCRGRPRCEGDRRTNPPSDARRTWRGRSVDPRLPGPSDERAGTMRRRRGWTRRPPARRPV